MTKPARMLWYGVSHTTRGRLSEAPRVFSGRVVPGLSRVENWRAYRVTFLPTVSLLFERMQRDRVFARRGAVKVGVEYLANAREMRQNKAVEESGFRFWKSLELGRRAVNARGRFHVEFVHLEKSNYSRALRDLYRWARGRQPEHHARPLRPLVIQLLSEHHPELFAGSRAERQAARLAFLGPVNVARSDAMAQTAITEGVQAAVSGDGHARDVNGRPFVRVRLVAPPQAPLEPLARARHERAGSSEGRLGLYGAFFTALERRVADLTLPPLPA